MTVFPVAFRGWRKRLGVKPSPPALAGGTDEDVVDALPGAARG